MSVTSDGEWICPEAVLSPRWELHTMAFNGAPIPVLSIMLPRQGRVDIAWSDAELDRLEDALRAGRLLRQGNIDPTGHVG